MAERKSGGASRGDQPAKSAGEHQYSEDIGTALIDGLTFSSKAVQYAVIDGMALVEGDINLGPVEQVQGKTEVRRQEATGAPFASGVVISGSQFRWPNCLIPYEIDDGLPSANRVTDAIAHWEARTNYRFVLRTPANEGQYPDWVEFVPGSGCSSFVGRQGGRQTVTLASGCSTGSCIHEIGHVVGLWHEQSREDRDTFITVNFANVIPSAVHNFFQHISDGDDVGAYDYGSIMHYPRTAFSVNGQDTIVPTDPNAQIGQRNELSPGDVAAANSLCPPAPPVFPTRTFPTRTFPTGTFPTRTFPTRTFPTRTFPTRTFPPPLTFPTRTFPTRTFPPPLTGPRTFPPPLTFPTRTFPTRTFPPPLTGPRTFPPPLTFPTRTFPPPLTGPRTFPPPLTFPTRTFPPPLTGPRTFPPPLTGPRTFPPPLTGPRTFPLIGPRFDPSDPYGYGGYADPYGYGADPYGYGADPYGYSDPYGYGADPYGYGADPYGYGSDPYGYEAYGDPYGAAGYEGGYDPYGATGYEGYDPYGTAGGEGYEGYEGYDDPYGYGG